MRSLQDYLTLPEFAELRTMIHDAVAGFEPDVLADMRAGARELGLSVEAFVLYKYVAHRRLCPIEPGDEETEEYAALFARVMGQTPKEG
jgi:hypothetical protein